jgi:uncharacterized protein (DUF305 family)
VRARLGVAAALAAAAVLTGCSSDSSDGKGTVAAPSPVTTIGPAAAAVADPPADDSVDVGFSRDMRVHHAQAVQMAMTVRDLTQDEATRRLAYDIATTQQEQTGRMAGWLQLWGRPLASERPVMQWMSPGAMGAHGVHAATGLMPGMATQEQLDTLDTLRGRDAEVLFLQLMITHHESGVAMARDAQNRAGVQQVRDLARTMVEGQSSEIDLMRQMLAARGA